MKQRLAATLIAIMLLGAGCQPIPQSSQSAEPSGMPSPEGYVEFRNGFGKIPGMAPRAKSLAGGSQISWTIEPPKPITEATVLRREPTLTDPSFLQNLTSALRIPAGALLAKPIAKKAIVQWADERGYLWTFDAETNRITFSSNTSSNALTVSSLPDDDIIVSTAYQFMKDRGLADPSWGKPSLLFSWNSWWHGQQNANLCMTASDILTIRTLATRPNVWPLLPQLSSNQSGACVAPEFPTKHIVRFQMQQDNQLVYDASGVGISIATIVVDADTNAVDSGVIELQRDNDRSNYPVKSQSTVLLEVRNGGIRGNDGLAENDRVSITNFTYGLYRHDALVNGTIRTFLIPSLIANGTITYANGATAPYTTLVPLVSNESYSGS